MTKVTLPVADGKEVSFAFEYDRQNRLQYVTPGDGARMRLDYDAAGQWQGSSFPDGARMILTKDGSGNINGLKQVSKPMGRRASRLKGNAGRGAYTLSAAWADDDCAAATIMKRMTRAACLILSGLMLTLPAAAQENRRPRSRAAGKTLGATGRATPTPNQRTALFMLEQIFEAAKSFEDDLLKIKTQANVADILWPYDEPRARQQFEESFRAIDSAKSTGGDVFAAMASPSGSPSAELRHELLAMIARRDADLAKKLIDASTEKSADKDSTQGTRAAAQGTRFDLYLQAAQGIAASDPERAVQLAKAGLSGGINHELLKVLLTVRQASPALADDLFRAALAVARRDSVNAPLHVATLAAYALPEFTTPAPPAAPGTADVAAPGGTPLIREFLDFAADTFLQLSGVAAQLGTPGATARTSAPNPVDMMTGQRLLPSFVRYMPAKAALFRQALDTMARRTTRDQETAGVNKLFQPAGADELLEQAQSEKNVHLKDLLYVRAAMSAASGGDFEQALSIIGKLEDAERRTSFDSVLRFQAASASLKKDDVDAALRYAKGVADLRQRAFLYGRIARSLLDKDDVGRATETLNDAELLVAKADDSVTKASALVVLAEVKSRLSPAQGFELLETAVKTFNRADADEAQKGRAVEAGGNPVTTMMLNAVFKLDAPNFEPVFSRLAKVDFDRAAQLARTLERKDRSVAAQIAVCRSALATKPTKTVATALGSEKRH